MILCDVSVNCFEREVKKNNYKIIIYGYGVIGKITAPQFLLDLGLKNNFCCYVDADKHKQGKYDNFGLGKINVCNPEKMAEIRDEFVILITGSRYASILDYLEKQEKLRAIKVFILPLMLEKESSFNKKIDIWKASEEQVIPKVIHYCWFGGEPLSASMKKCMATWKKYCPDYEIVRWDEKNYDVYKYKYMKQAYESGKWAFVSDVARIDILYEYGGIYLDTDVELIKNLDELLYQPGFCGVEKWRILNSGGGCGGRPRNSMIGKILDLRKEIEFIFEDGMINMESSGIYETLPFLRNGFKADNTFQIINDMAIYPSDVFHPFDSVTKKCNITENTFSIHHFSGTWL